MRSEHPHSHAQRQVILPPLTDSSARARRHAAALVMTLEVDVPLRQIEVLSRRAEHRLVVSVELREAAAC